jgi:hypothetical protein
MPKTKVSLSVVKFITYSRFCVAGVKSERKPALVFEISVGHEISLRSKLLNLNSGVQVTVSGSSRQVQVTQTPNKLPTHNIPAFLSQYPA